MASNSALLSPTFPFHLPYCDWTVAEPLPFDWACTLAECDPMNRGGSRARQHTSSLLMAMPRKSTSPLYVWKVVLTSVLTRSSVCRT